MLKLFTGETKSTKTGLKDERRMFLSEMDLEDSKKILDFFKKKKILILDRFVIDTAVELAINTDQDDNFDSISKKFFKFIPNNSMIFFLDIDPKISYERNHEEDLITLQKKRKIYQKICKSLNISIIDGTKSIEIIHNGILTHCKFVK